MESERQRCLEYEKVFHECLCIHSGDNTTNFENAKILDTVGARMNEALRDLAEKYDWGSFNRKQFDARSSTSASRASGLPFEARQDVAVNVVSAWNRSRIPSLDFLSELDCFHPSSKTHNLMAHAVWNSMLGVQKGPIDFNNRTQLEPACAYKDTKLVSFGTHPRTPRFDSVLV